MENSYRTVPIVHWGMLFAALVYVVIAERLVRPPESSIEPVMLISMTGVGVLVAVTALIVRKIFVLPSASSLAADPGNLAVLNRWRAACIVSFAMGESVVLFGLVARFLGAQTKQAALLYVLGIAVLLIATPRKPAVAIPGMLPQP